MISVICGPKGSGKTKEIIGRANEALDVCKGNIVFLTDSPDCSRDVSTAIRYINLRDYGKVTEESLLGFLGGVVPSNSDGSKLYLDGLARLLGMPADGMEELFIGLEDLSENHDVDICVSVTCDKPPKFLKKYL